MQTTHECCCEKGPRRRTTPIAETETYVHVANSLRTESTYVLLIRTSTYVSADGGAYVGLPVRYRCLCLRLRYAAEQLHRQAAKQLYRQAADELHRPAADQLHRQAAQEPQMSIWPQLQTYVGG